MIIRKVINQKMEKRQTALNISFTALAFLLSMGINFVITPVLLKELGDEAYGFIGMSNDFISYMTIISSVFNSVAGRFIAFEIHKNDYKRANQYFSSLLMVDIIISCVAVILGIVFVAYMELIINIPSELLWDVKITFLLVIFNFFLVTVTSVFAVSTYVKNRLDLAGVRNIISYVVKALILVIIFNLLPIKLYFVSIATIISTIILAITNLSLTKKLTPELKFKIADFKVSMIKSLASSGIWMALSNLSAIFMTGLDTFITNYFIGVKEMGVLTAARTIPNSIILAISNLGVVFTPAFVAQYARGEIDKLVASVEKSVKIMGIIFAPIVIGVIVYGTEFYKLWMPYKTEIEIQVIQIVSVLTVVQSVLNAMTISLAQISVVTNRLKEPVFVSVVLGIANVIISVLLIQFTDLGIYAIAGVSSFLFIIRYLTFNPIFAAHILKQRWSIFFPVIFRTFIPVCIITIVYIKCRPFLDFTNWLHFIVSVLIMGCLGYIIMILFTLEKEQCKKIGTVIKGMKKR